MKMSLIDVYVKLPSGRTSSIQIAKYKQISEICKHVASEENVPAERVILKYQGKILDNNKTVGQYGVRPETILKGEVIFPKDITVYVKLPDGRCVTVPIQNTSTTNNIKDILESQEGLRNSDHFIKVSNLKVTNESYPLFSVGIKEESVLELCAKEAAVTSSDAREESVTTATEPDEIPTELKETMLSSFAADGRNVEVVFSFDTTGSMSQYLKSVRTNLQETCRRLIRDIPNIRIGIMAHGDYFDSPYTYTLRHIDLTSNVDELVQFAMKTPSTAGGDTPECYELVLSRAQMLDWSENSAKALVVIGDCEPHPPSFTDQKINWWTEASVLSGMEIKIYGVFCGKNRSNAYNFYEEIAEQTGGCVLNLKHFSLVTEMFLGVCYNEAAPKQLEAFTEELRKDGKLTEEASTLMNEIAQTKSGACALPEKEEKSKRYVAEAWWDVSKDNKKLPSFLYDQANDKWSPRNRKKWKAKVGPPIIYDEEISCSELPSTRKKSKVKCSIM